MRRRAELVVRTLLAALAMSCVDATAVRAQDTTEPAELTHAYDLESAGKFREAASIFRSSLYSSPSAGALLGLERMYAELRISDSLLPLLDTLIQRQPREPLYHTVQLRTLQILRRDDQLREAFERWRSVAPNDPAPYREYANVLIAMGRPVAADSVVQRGRRALGNMHAMAFETAQLRAAQGAWEASALAWHDALVDAPDLADAAGFALGPTPAGSRDAVRAALRAGRDLGSRRALAALELGWGRPSEAWDALRIVAPDTAAATAWANFGTQALADDRFTIAREALAAAIRVRRTSALAVHAATAALRSGAPADVAALLPLSEADADPRLVRDYVPLHVAALSALGRPADAAALVARYDAALAPGQRERLARDVANAFVRTGDLARARAALGAGPDADSSEAAGWLALYEGRLSDARALLKNARDVGPDLAFALGVVARTRGTDGRELGAGFLALARGDTVSAETHFIEAADTNADAGPALLLEAARLRATRGNGNGAMELWRRIVERSSDAPEAAEAELEWARALRSAGDRVGAIARLEHLILNSPQSALLPQARRELELERAAIPTPE